MRHISVSVVGFFFSNAVMADDEQTNDAEPTAWRCNLTPQVRRAGKRGIDISVGAVGFLQVRA